MNEFYLQDSRNNVGNDLLFWAKGDNGYTTNLRLAEVYSKEDAERKNRARATDIPWPKDYIDNKTRPAVDVQHVKIEEALAGTGITLCPPKKAAKKILKCGACGVFLTQEDYYTGYCKCGNNER